MNKYVFPGDSPAALKRFYLVGLAIAILSSLRYFLRFTYVTYNNEKLYAIYGCSPDNPMLDLAMKHIFIGSSIFIFICLMMIIRNYALYYQFSKSIYLMKRLPDPAELHIRSLLYPLSAILLCAFLTASFMFLYYLYYVNLIGINCDFSILEALL